MVKKCLNKSRISYQITSDLDVYDKSTEIDVLSLCMFVYCRRVSVTPGHGGGQDTGYRHLCFLVL